MAPGRRASPWDASRAGLATSQARGSAADLLVSRLAQAGPHLGRYPRLRTGDEIGRPSSGGVVPRARALARAGASRRSRRRALATPSNRALDPASAVPGTAGSQARGWLAQHGRVTSGCGSRTARRRGDPRAAGHRAFRHDAGASRGSRRPTCRPSCASCLSGEADRARGCSRCPRGPRRAPARRGRGCRACGRCCSGGS